LLPGIERVTPATYLNLYELSGGAGDKGIATGTDYLGIMVVFGVELLLHWARTETFLCSRL
jgi:hypothetical protein